MPLFSFEGKSPRVHPTAFIAPTANLIGDVTVEENASVWYNTVLRADFNPIVIRRGANVQDCAVIHVTPAGGVEIGPGATVGHLCLVHAATVGEEALAEPRTLEPDSEPRTPNPEPVYVADLSRHPVLVLLAMEHDGAPLRRPDGLRVRGPVRAARPG